MKAKGGIADITKTKNVTFRDIAKTVKIFETEEKKFLKAQKKYLAKKYKVIDHMYKNLVRLIPDKELRAIITLKTEYKKVKKPVLWLLLSEMVSFDERMPQVLDVQCTIRCGAKEFEDAAGEVFRNYAYCETFSLKLQNYWKNDFRLRLKYSPNQATYYFYGTTTRFFTEEADL